VLRDAGWLVIDAVDVADAFRHIHGDAPPDIIIVELDAPGVDAEELCDRLAAEPDHVGIPVMFTSAMRTDSGARARGLELGADVYLPQPFDAGELFAQLRALLRRRAHDLELRNRAQRLEEADRRKDEFLAVLVHELRNPLNVLTTSQALLADRPPRDTVEARAFAAMQRQTDHLRHLVDDLLDASRVTRGDIEVCHTVVDLAVTLERTLQSVRELMFSRRNQTLVGDLVDGPVWVLGDEARLEQVFVHLLDNASKYTPEHGRVTVQLRVVEDQARITVHDDGMGMTSTTLARIFGGLRDRGDPEEMSQRPGMGVGLALAKTLVEAHGGSIAAHSKGLNRGSRFVVSLPLTDAPEDADVPGPEPQEEIGNGGRTVLLVEDNDDARDLLHALCSRWGHRVLTAASGEQALAVAESEPIDAAVIDLGLPGIDGYEVARRLRASATGAGIRLIALTGYGSYSARDGARRAGFDFHLVKPCEPDALRRVLDPSTGEN